MNWKPSNEPVRYDKQRVATFRLVTEAVAGLSLPLLRSRKLQGIGNAIEMQIEDGGDSPEVNDHLLAALRGAVIHQVGERDGAAVLHAIEAFRKAEAAHWKLIRSGVPLPVDPKDELDDLVEEGQAAFAQSNARVGCDRWLAAWEIVRRLAKPELRTAMAFYLHYDLAHHLDAWSSELMFELQNVAVKDARYHERRSEFSRQYLALFPDEDAETQARFLRGQGKALWELGRRDEAEAVYGALVERFPDFAWGYIGWADHYWLWSVTPKDYARAEAIMTPALARPQLQNRSDLLDRLQELYSESGQQDKLSQLKQSRVLKLVRPSDAPSARVAVPSPRLTAPPSKPGRNDPCWCGSGKKYKRCHLRADTP
jgi:tetratricopeptide (TPR) repeat protein